MSLAEYIAAVRKKRGHTQMVAATLVGVDPLTWGRWEHGQIPTLRRAYKLADYLGTTLNKLRPFVENTLQDEPSHDKRRARRRSGGA